MINTIYLLDSPKLEIAVGGCRNGLHSLQGWLVDTSLRESCSSALC